MTDTTRMSLDFHDKKKEPRIGSRKDWDLPEEQSHTTRSHRILSPRSSDTRRKCVLTVLLVLVLSTCETGVRHILLNPSKHHSVYELMNVEVCVSQQPHFESQEEFEKHSCEDIRRFLTGLCDSSPCLFSYFVL